MREARRQHAGDTAGRGNGVRLAHIVAAEFKESAAAQVAVAELRAEGFAPSQLTTFHLNPPPDQHAKFPIGGDEFEDHDAAGPGAGAVKGAALGSAAGLALGIAAAPVAGVAAVAGRAYAGSLAGAVGALGKGQSRPEPPTVRPAAVVVSVNVPTPAERERATTILWRHRAHSIEVAEGTWRDGTWQDFDPVSMPHWRKASAA